MTVGEALARAVHDAARERIVFPRDFHGFPGTVHGGAVAALFLRLAQPRLPARVELALRHGVPVETSLGLSGGRAGAAARLALADSQRVLAEATVSRVPPRPGDAAGSRIAWPEAGRPDGELPGTLTCLACGTANPLGLQIRFLWNARFLWREYTPRPEYRDRDGSAHPALAPILLDELGWWLGALAQQECGVTTEVSVTLRRPIPFAPLLALGDRLAVEPDADPRGRYSRASGILIASDGEVVAQGTVRFAGSRAYTRRLLAPFLETTELEALAAHFPSARDLSRRP